MGSVVLFFCVGFVRVGVGIWYDVWLGFLLGLDCLGGVVLF